MERNRGGFLDDGTYRECTSCGAIFKKTSKTVTLCNVCNSNRVKSNDPIRKMLARAKSRARLSGLDFNLETTDIVIPQFCPILGIELKEHRGSSGGKPNSPALDRIDNSKGYIKNNVMVISHLANQMKASSNREEMIKFARWVLSQDWQELTNPV